MNTQDTTQPDFISVAEYLRRIWKRERDKNPLSRNLTRHTLNRYINRGTIVLEEIDGNLYIDWNKYKDQVFKVYYRNPHRPIVEITNDIVQPTQNQSK